MSIWDEFVRRLDDAEPEQKNVKPVCPVCTGDLKVRRGKYVCTECGETYHIGGNVKYRIVETGELLS